MVKRSKLADTELAGCVKWGSKSSLLAEWGLKVAATGGPAVLRSHYPAAEYFEAEADSQVPLPCGVALFRKGAKWMVATPCLHTRLAEYEEDPLDCFRALSVLKVKDSRDFDRKVMA